LRRALLWDEGWVGSSGVDLQTSARKILVFAKQVDILAGE
jgi:hypothetical protein